MTLARTGSVKRDLVEAYAWLQIASQSELTAEVRIVVFAKMEDLGSRLGPDRRNDARATRGTHRPLHQGARAFLRARCSGTHTGITANRAHTGYAFNRGARMKSILDSTFKYYPSVQTDLRRTFRRVRQKIVAQRGSQRVTSQAKQAAPRRGDATA